MNFIKKKLSIYTFIVMLFSPLMAQQVVVKTPNGESYVLHVAPENPFCEVVNNIQAFVSMPEEDQKVFSEATYFEPENGTKCEFCFDFTQSGLPLMPVASPTSIPRNFHVPVTPHEKHDIAFIVLTLTKSVPTLISKRSHLKKVGARINHIHPLKFLSTVFTDDELIVGVANINSWAWSDFIGGLTDSLAEEAGRDNMKDEYIIETAQVIGVDPEIFFSYADTGDWVKLVEKLIKIKIEDRKKYPNRDQ